MNRTQKIIILFSIIVVASIYSYQLMNQHISPGDVSVEEAANLIATLDGLVILDVRTQEEYDVEHIEGSILIPVQELEGRINELSKDDPFLVYCRTGNRSRTAVTILEENGFTKIYQMSGGIIAWIAANYTTI